MFGVATPSKHLKYYSSKCA